jgi:hypothetical protein
MKSVYIFSAFISGILCEKAMDAWIANDAHTFLAHLTVGVVIMLLTFLYIADDRDDDDTPDGFA